MERSSRNVRGKRKHQDRENLVPSENIGNRFASLPNVRGECHAGFENLNSSSEGNTMNTTKIAASLAAVVVAFAATAADANTRYRNVDSLVTQATGGGQIIVALDISCRNGGNFVMQTDRNTDELYRGCAYRDGSRVLINWNDGQSVSYSPSVFRRTTAWMNV
jgi:hypothetical protein